jgi:hypothetical protein
LQGYRMMSTLSRCGTSSPITSAPGSSSYEQTTRRLRVREQEQVLLAHRAHVGMRQHPFEVPPAPARHMPGPRRRPRAVDERHHRMVDDRGDPLALASLNRWPSRPNPVTSVAHLIPAAIACRPAPAFSVVITSTAAALTEPVALRQALSTPDPIGLVRLSGRPGRPASIRSSAAGSAVPVTAIPYFGSGSSMLCPPAT